MPYIGGDVAGRGIDALDTVTNSTEPSSGRQLVMQYLMSKGLPQTGENMRRALEANARDPGTITNLVNNAPSTDAEDYAAGARGPASPGYGGPTAQGSVGRGGGGSVARRVEGGGAGDNTRGNVDEGGWGYGDTSTAVKSGAAPTTAPNGVATTSGTPQPTPTDSSGWNWPKILGLTGGAGAGASLLYAANRNLRGGGSPTTSAPPTQAVGGPRVGSSGPMPQPTAVAEGAPVEIPAGMRPVGSAVGNSVEVPPPIMPVAPPVAPPPSTAVDMDAVMQRSAGAPPPSAADVYANRPQQAGPPGSQAAIDAAKPPAWTPPKPGTSPADQYKQRPGQPPPPQPEPAPDFVNDMVDQRNRRPMAPGPSSPNPVTRNTGVATDPARLEQLRQRTGVPPPDMATRARIMQAIRANVAEAARVGTQLMRRP